MDVSRLMMAHLAGEIVVIGGVSYFFQKKLNELRARIDELEKRGVGGGDPTQFQQQTMQHISKLYALVERLSSERAPATCALAEPPLDRSAALHDRSAALHEEELDEELSEELRELTETEGAAEPVREELAPTKSKKTVRKKKEAA